MNDNFSGYRIGYWLSILCLCVALLATLRNGYKLFLLDQATQVTQYETAHGKNSTEDLRKKNLYISLISVLATGLVARSYRRAVSRGESGK